MGCQKDNRFRTEQTLSHTTIKADQSGRFGQPAIYLLIPLLILILSACNRDGPLTADTSIEQLSNTINSNISGLIEKYRITGLSVGVIRDGQLCLLRSFGRSRTSPEKRLDENTLFRVASLGKPVFAYIVVALAKQGLLDLDAPSILILKRRSLMTTPGQRKSPPE